MLVCHLKFSCGLTQALLHVLGHLILFAKVLLTQLEAVLIVFDRFRVTFKVLALCACVVIRDGEGHDEVLSLQGG